MLLHYTWVAALIDSEQILSIKAQLCTHKECKTFQVATEEGFCSLNVSHSLCVHSCAQLTFVLNRPVVSSLPKVASSII